MLSLGGGQGNGPTDPSAHSDLKGREVGTSSAEPHDILSPSCGTSLKSQGRAWVNRTFPKTRWLAQFPRSEDERMCWFSTEYANRVEEAKTGQRLGIKQMDWYSNWQVRETEIDARRPCPVCLIDQTRVLFRFSESQQASLHLGTEAEAVFRMLKRKRPKRDIFEFADGKQITLDDLPAGLIFDVIAVPGSEQLSAVLNREQAVHDEEETEKDPFLARLLAHF